MASNLMPDNGTKLKLSNEIKCPSDKYKCRSWQFWWHEDEAANALQVPVTCVGQIKLKFTRGVCTYVEHSLWVRTTVPVPVPQSPGGGERWMSILTLHDLTRLKYASNSGNIPFSPQQHHWKMCLSESSVDICHSFVDIPKPRSCQELLVR